MRTEINLVGAETAGALCLLVDQPPPGCSLPPHRHANEGETAHVSKDVLHSGSNVGAATGRRILAFSPAGIEDFFLEAGSPSAEREADADTARAAAARDGWELPSSSG